MIEIARIFTTGTANRRDIVRRLMACCESFKQLTIADAMAQFRSYEQSGLIVYGDGFLAIYHDCN